MRNRGRVLNRPSQRRSALAVTCAHPARLATALLLTLAISWALPAGAQTDTRGARARAEASMGVPVGTIRALLISVDQYQHLDRLRAPPADVAALQKVFDERYLFDAVTVLQNPSLRELDHALSTATLGLGENDSLLIWFAGHGVIERSTGAGYWVPPEATDADDYMAMYPVTRLTTLLESSKGRHILVVSDNCYSAVLLARREATVRAIDLAYYREQFRNPSRAGLTSGGLAPVADASVGGLSPFAGEVVALLKSEERPYLDARDIYDGVRQVMFDRHRQMPEYAPVGRTSGVAGAFVFIRKARPTPPGMVAIPPGAFLMGIDEAEVGRAHKQCVKLDPACDRSWFADAVPVHRVDLPNYAIDRTEVTNESYSACESAGACSAPSLSICRIWDPDRAEWRDGGIPDARLRAPGVPVSCVTWAQADAYCRHVGKRLPTEAEWEKAARGTDGRIYPWGDRYKGKKVQPGAPRLPAVAGANPKGSPYGVLDLAGNVTEWVADWYGAYPDSALKAPRGPAEGTARVHRGGSFLDDRFFQRSYFRASDLPDFAGSVVGFRCAVSL